MGIKEKKLGGVKTVRAGVPKELSLEQKRAVGQSIIEGRYTAAEAGKMYGVSPQAVGWWKRLAEREEAAEKSEGDIRTQIDAENPPEGHPLYELMESLQLATEDAVIYTQIHGRAIITLQVPVEGYERNISYTVEDLRITENITQGTGSIHFNFSEDK
jgi:hypothetical protein